MTVGSQVAVFEELKLFQQSDNDIPNAVVHSVDKPANVKHWLNVFDKDDVLGFATERVFAGTADFSFDTEGGVISSHSKYFTMPSFHQRLCERIKGVLA